MDTMFDRMRRVTVPTTSFAVTGPCTDVAISPLRNPKYCAAFSTSFQ